ncbi:unnamed protein product, partial [marine sediment metagenome]
MKKLKINREIYSASQLNVKGGKTELLVSIVKELDGNVYLSGAGARNYLDESVFKKEKIEILYYQYGSFIYPQLWGKFIP